MFPFHLLLRVFQAYTEFRYFAMLYTLIVVLPLVKNKLITIATVKFQRHLTFLFC